jgi:hypothetical protein
MASLFRTRGDALAWLGVGLAVTLALALTAHRVWISPDGRVIGTSADAPWIEATPAFSAHNRQWGLRKARPTVFTRRFEATQATSARLELRAFGAFKARLNGVALPFEGRPQNWKQRQSLDVTQSLRVGENTLVIDVRNMHGPALLSLRLALNDSVITSDTDWRVSFAGRPPRAARIATDLAVHPQNTRVATPLSALSRLWLPVFGLFAAASAGCLLALRRDISYAHMRAGGLVLVILMWAWVFVSKTLSTPERFGFDVSAHLEYLRIVTQEARVPLATDGWSTYHPPLYYWLVALSRALGESFGPTGTAIFTRLLGFVAGLGIALISGRVATRLWPDRPLLGWVALSFSAVLPINLLLSGYVTNEVMLALWSACAILVSLDILLDEAPSPRAFARLSLFLGLALLTKFTALIVALVSLAFVIPKLIASAGPRARPIALRMTALLGPALLIAGWFYLRNVYHYGAPIVGNWDLPGEGRTWWSPPGFHTSAYYLSFGQALVHPFFSAFGSFWDALYSTLWGDGLLSGATDLEGRNPAWRYDWMSASYALALPLSLAIGSGFLLMCRSALRELAPERRMAFGFLCILLAATLFMLFYASLALPFHGQAKAFYGLAIAPALAICFASFYGSAEDALSRSKQFSVLGKSLLFGWWTTTGAALYLVYAA